MPRQAPTAQHVELLHWRQLRGGEPEVHSMTRNSKGVWSLSRPANWHGTCYKYRVTAFCPWTNKIETMEATDPYSRCTTGAAQRGPSARIRTRVHMHTRGCCVCGRGRWLRSCHDFPITSLSHTRS